MRAALRSVKRLMVGLAGVALLLSFGAGCGSLPSSGDSDDPLEQPEFLGPVREAQDAGLNLYWLGADFRGGALTFSISGFADLFNRNEQVSGLQFEYGGKTGRGSVTLDLESYPPGGDGETALRERALSIPGSRAAQVRVGHWDGEVFYLPAGARPVNALWLFVDVGNSTIVVQASSGGPGIPGQDPNPLIDKDLLIQVVAEHLRPYPE